MARMLQALKNLEARSPRPVAGRAAAKEPKADVPSVPVVTTVVEEKPEPVAESLPKIEQPDRYEEKTPTVDVPPLPAWSAHLSGGLREVKEAPAGRPATAVERQVRRTLSDPSRGLPLTQLAERIRRDIEQTGSKTLVFVGVGATSATHQTLLYTAARLAELLQDKVLLVDADLPRMAVSESLEFGGEKGLAELVRGEGLPRESCQETSFKNLAFLPAGKLRHDDLSTAGSRLEGVVKNLATEFSCLLVDGGRTGDLAASSLARLADATYLVVQLGTVETSEAQAALRDFRAAGARVLGCVAT